MYVKTKRLPVDSHKQTNRVAMLEKFTTNNSLRIENFKFPAKTAKLPTTFS